MTVNQCTTVVPHHISLAKVINSFASGSLQATCEDAARIRWYVILVNNRNAPSRSITRTVVSALSVFIGSLFWRHQACEPNDEAKELFDLPLASGKMR